MIKGEDTRGRTLDDLLAWPDEYLERSHNYIQILFPLPEGSPFNFDAPVVNREVFDAFRERSELRGRMREAFLRMLKFYGFETLDMREERERKVREEEGHDGEDKVEAKTEEEKANRWKDEESREADGEDKETEAPLQTKTIAPEKAEESAPSSTQHQPPIQPSLLAIEADEDPSSSTTPTLTILPAPNWRRNSTNWVHVFDHNHLRLTRILRSLRVLGLQAECDALFAALEEVYDSSRISDRTMNYWRRAVRRALYIAPDDERIGWLKMWEDEVEALRIQEEGDVNGEGTGDGEEKSKEREEGVEG